MLILLLLADSIAFSAHLLWHTGAFATVDSLLRATISNNKWVVVA